MRFKCLCLDHDDTVVNSTATIHFPCFIQYLAERHPHLKDRYTLEEYLAKNFSPGVVEFFTEEIGMSREELKEEETYWQEYVKTRVPNPYPGIRELLAEFRARGGIIAVASHSFTHYIERDYRLGELPAPDAIYGWDLPRDRRKPSPFALLDIMERYSLRPDQILTVDDLKPGYDMARTAGVPIAAAGWAYNVPSIESFMRANCDFYLSDVKDFEQLVFD